MFRKLAAECFGTFWLVFGGCGSAVLAAGFPELGIGFAGVALAFGLTVLTMAFAVGHISGGHFNPAVTIGLWAGGRFPAKEVVGYVIAQVVGGIVAAALLYLIASGKTGFDAAASGFASNGYGEHSPGGYSMLSALVVELVLSAGFLLVIHGATDKFAPAGFAPIAIGLPAAPCTAPLRLTPGRLPAICSRLRRECKMAFNMDPKKCPMPTQDPNVRNKNFEEVALGYTAEMAVNEAKRCIHCKNKPCQTGCPVGIDIPEFIGHVAEGDFEAAYQVINRSSSLPAVCGRVCPQESQCEGKCTRGIKNEPVGIGRLERFVADWHRENVHTAPVVPASNGHKVAIIGAGPAGLTAAGDHAKLGYKVTVYEALHVAGGVLMYGIPEFRLPKAIVQQEIDGLKKMGVDFECNMVIGKVLTIDELMGEYGYEAVFVGSGAGLPRFMGIPGESLKGVYSANEFLTRSNLMKAYLPTSKTPIRTGRKVAVVGGGNVAMDAARSALRLGAETVYIVYRRGMAELPARKEEVEHAEEEGIIFKTLCNPVEILSDEDGFVKAITCIEMELGEPDASGRRRPIEKKGSEFTMDVDTVIMSLGTSPNPLIRSTTPGLETNKHGCIVTEGDEGKTSREGVYAGGDAVTGAATVIKAMGAGKAAAKAIDEYIQNK